MQMGHLCVLVHVWTGGRVGAERTSLGPPVKYFY